MLASWFDESGLTVFFIVIYMSDKQHVDSASTQAQEPDSVAPTQKTEEQDAPLHRKKVSRQCHFCLFYSYFRMIETLVLYFPWNSKLLTSHLCIATCPQGRWLWHALLWDGVQRWYQMRPDGQPSQGIFALCVHPGRAGWGLWTQGVFHVWIRGGDTDLPAVPTSWLQVSGVDHHCVWVCAIT